MSTQRTHYTTTCRLWGYCLPGQPICCLNYKNQQVLLVMFIGIGLFFLDLSVYSAHLCNCTVSSYALLSVRLCQKIRLDYNLYLINYCPLLTYLTYTLTMTLAGGLTSTSSCILLLHARLCGQILKSILLLFLRKCPSGIKCHHLIRLKD